MLRRRYGTRQLDRRSTSRPATQMWPESMVSSRKSSLRSVVLPEPDAPTTKTNSPFVISSETSRRATTEPLYDFVTLSKRIMVPCHATSGLCYRDMNGRNTSANLAWLTGVLPSPAEKRDHCVVEIPIQHGFHVAGLVPASQVFHKLVRGHHVGADLAAPSDIGLGACQGVEV